MEIVFVGKFRAVEVSPRVMYYSAIQGGHHCDDLGKKLVMRHASGAIGRLATPFRFRFSCSHPPCIVHHFGATDPDFWYDGVPPWLPSTNGI